MSFNTSERVYKLLVEVINLLLVKHYKEIYTQKIKHYNCLALYLSLSFVLPTSITLFFCLSLYVILLLSPCFCFPMSQSVCFSCLSLYRCLSFWFCFLPIASSFSLPPFPSVPLCLPLFLSTIFSLSLSVSFYPCLSFVRSLCFYLLLCVALSLPLSFTLFLCLFVSPFYLSFCTSLPLFISLCFSLSYLFIDDIYSV